MTTYISPKQYARAKAGPPPPRKRRRRPYIGTASTGERGLSEDAKARVRAAYEALGVKPPKECG